ncbi:MAG: hypothetical protein N2323_05805 [candidate division WOR-3 bacterium]|nr:hypothetical protein [candidate division WOR-3 bacterium]MCX7837448.1 hypothetical protein [candidate division WOR-3 bacterium]MDW8113616.1 hypothetical protein [candidate division WOR-3 bacterium]
MVEKLNLINKYTRLFLRLVGNYEKTKLKKENLSILETNLKKIKEYCEKLEFNDLKNLVSEWIKKEEEWLKNAFIEKQESFGRELKEELEKNNLSFSGIFPNIKINIFTLEINFDLNSCQLFYGPKIEKLKAKIPLHAPTIIKILKDYLNYLNYPFNPNEYFKKLLSAYERFISFQRLNFGEKIFLTDLLSELIFLLQKKEFYLDPKRENFKEYSRINFSYDLYRLKTFLGNQLENYSFKLWIAPFDATLDRRKSIWIPNNETGEGTYFSYISFEKI